MYHGWNRSKHHRISIVLLFLLQLTIIQKKRALQISQGLTGSKGQNLYTFSGDFSWSLKGLDVFDPIGEWSMKMGGRVNIMDYSCFNMSTPSSCRTKFSKTICDLVEKYMFLVSSLSPPLAPETPTPWHKHNERTKTRVLHQGTRRYRAMYQRYVQRPSADMDGGRNKKKQHPNLGSSKLILSFIDWTYTYWKATPPTKEG